MILNGLTMTNFGVFHATQQIDLSPKGSRVITLFGGKNGAGKSTILDAIRLCFYGFAAAHVRSRDEYHRYLAERIHIPNSMVPSVEASIQLTFQYADFDSVHVY